MRELNGTRMPLDVMFRLNETWIYGPNIFEREGLSLREIDLISQRQVREKNLSKILTNNKTLVDSGV